VINKKKPFFSIITVTKNSERFIERNIKSVLNQTIKDYEHIIIDGKSNDKTLEIINKYKKKISYFISKKDKNMWDAINKGLKISKGQIIVILNSDDIFYKNGLKIVKKKIINENLDCLFAAVRKKKVYHGHQLEKLYYKFNVFPSHSIGFFLKKKIYNEIGFYDKNFDYCADYDLIYRLYKKNIKIGITSKKEVVGKFYPGGISENINYFSYIRYQAKVRIKNKQNIFYVIILSILTILYKYFLGIVKNTKQLF
jgi:glycosyltransferase involved in cell wall biosynthesis